MKRLILIVAVTLLVALPLAPAAGAEGGGANQNGDFTPTNPVTTDPSNDHGNRPEDGSVGNADGKNPPGQSHKPEDDNAGYECDDNNGIGKGNPAHSACADDSDEPDTPPTPECQAPGGCTITDIKTPHDEFQTRADDLLKRQTEVLGVVLEKGDAAVTAGTAEQEQLAYTGAFTDTLVMIGGILLIVGLLALASTKRWNPRT